MIFSQELREEPRLPKELTDRTVSYTYNPQANRLLSTSESGFSYDEQGQQTDKNGTVHGWDGAHRLTQYGTNNFFYDGADRRLKTIRNGNETQYIYDASGNLIAEADAAGVIQRYYIYGAGLLAVIESNQTYTYHFNATGHAWALTDNTQTIVNSYAYTPYGQLVSETQTITQPFKYVGQYGVQTEPDGLLYMRARYYDPEIGRFISEDPIGMDGGLNLYAYAANNPVMLTDPSGKCPWCIAGAIFGGATGGYSALLQGKTGWDLAREVAFGAAFGAVGGGIATTGKITSILGKAATGSSLGATESIISQSASGQEFSWGAVGISAAAGGLAGLNTIGSPQGWAGAISGGFSAGKWGVAGAGAQKALKQW